MTYWENQLKKYMISKRITLDKLRWVTYYSNILQDTLQRISDVVETYEGFTVNKRRYKFSENIIFPVAVANFIIAYNSKLLVEYTFSFVADEPTAVLHLKVFLINHCHRRFDEELVSMMGETSLWLKNCELCDPFEKDLGEVDVLTVETVSGFVVDSFIKMTTDYVL